jgi:D-proline reductase (dithiol) PrdB
VIVDSLRFLPRSFAAMYDNAKPIAGEEEPVWTPFTGRLRDARLALVTSAGLYVEGEQPPFDVERERREPAWGDPTHRVLPAAIKPGQLGMAHLHVNPTDILEDHNVALPTDVLTDLEADGVIAGQTAHHASVMGYQAAGLEVWRTETAPAIVAMLRDEGADGVVLAPV